MELVEKLLARQQDRGPAKSQRSNLTSQADVMGHFNQMAKKDVRKKEETLKYHKRTYGKFSAEVRVGMTKENVKKLKAKAQIKADEARDLKEKKIEARAENRKNYLKNVGKKTHRR